MGKDRDLVRKRLDHGREPLVEQLVEAHDRGASDAAVLALLQFEVEEPLRLAEGSVDGLV